MTYYRHNCTLCKLSLSVSNNNRFIMFLESPNFGKQKQQHSSTSNFITFTKHQRYRSVTQPRSFTQNRLGITSQVSEISSVDV